MTAPLHVVVPERGTGCPSGGDVYGERLAAALGARRHVLAGAWPGDDAALARGLDGLPPGEPVVLDGLVAGGCPDVVVPLARRRPVVVVVHLPLADEVGLDPVEAARRGVAERAVLRAVHAVVAPSRWAAERVAARTPAGVVVAAPGTDAAAEAPGSPGGTRWLCVSALTPHKGQDVLVDALARVAGGWTCTLVGSGAAAATERVRGAIRRHGLADRVALAGPAMGAALDAAYAAADLVVLPSHGETFGMVVTESLARGLPVLTTTAGALPDTLGRAADGVRPGLLVPPGDPDALAAALTRWLADPALRARARAAARARRPALAGWDATARAVAGAVDRATAARAS